MNNQRQKQMEQWLQQQFPATAFTLTAITGDASYRRYFRLHDAQRSYVLMDAPPEQEDSKPFAYVAGLLARAGICVPEIVCSDLEQGFLLLTDFGDELLAQALQNNTADKLYRAAIDELIAMQAIPVTAASLPKFDDDFMWLEWQRTEHWFLQELLNLELSTTQAQRLEQQYGQLIKLISQQPQVFIHRDYHSRNLLVYRQQIGVIDFQDAMSGPYTYDVVSLLRDCYVNWPNERVIDWLMYYRKQSAFAHRSADLCVHDFDLAGLQRHIKCLGIFARLFLRDAKRAYLYDIPRTLNYVLSVSEKYPEFDVLHQVFHQASYRFQELALCAQ